MVAALNGPLIAAAAIIAVAALRTHFQGEAVLTPTCDPMVMHVGCAFKGYGAWRIAIAGKSYETRNGFTATLEP